MKTKSWLKPFYSINYYDTLPSSILTYHLLATGFITGMLDATTYADFGTFTSNQTGNSVLLGIGALHLSTRHAVDMVYVGTSLASFLVTVGVCGQVVNHAPGIANGRTRWWTILSSLYQSLTVLLVPALTYTHLIRVDGRGAWAVLLLLGSSAGSQVAMAKQFGVVEIPTAMLTSPFADVLTDPYLFSTTLTRPYNAPRNRRVGYILLLILGVFIGAALHRGTNSNVVLLSAGGLKVLVMISLFFVPKEVIQDDVCRCDDKQEHDVSDKAKV